MDDIDNEPTQDERRYDTIYESILKFIKAAVYFSAFILVSGMVGFWFFYEVEGKPLSSHTSDISVKLAKQLVEDGYFATAKVLFTEEEYCFQKTSRPVSCVSEEDQKKLDILIDRALFNGGPDGTSIKK